MTNVAIQQALSDPAWARPKRMQVKQGDVIAELAKIGFAIVQLAKVSVADSELHTVIHTALSMRAERATSTAARRFD